MNYDYSGIHYLLNKHCPAILATEEKVEEYKATAGKIRNAGSTYPHVSPDDPIIERICVAYGKGKSLEWINIHYKLSLTSIRRILKENGVKSRTPSQVQRKSK